MSKKDDTTRSTILPFFGPPDVSAGVNPGHPSGVKCTPEEAVRLQYAVKKWRLVGMETYHEVDADGFVIEKERLGTAYAMPWFGHEGSSYVGPLDKELEGPFPHTFKTAAYDLPEYAAAMVGDEDWHNYGLSSTASAVNRGKDFYEEPQTLYTHINSGPTYISSRIYSVRSADDTAGGGFRDGDDIYFNIAAFATNLGGKEHTEGGVYIHAFGKSFEIHMPSSEYPGGYRSSNLDIYADEYWSYGGAIDTDTGEFK